jgi:hypothetical protein
MTSAPGDVTTQEFTQELLSPQRDACLDTLAILSFSGISYRDRAGDALSPWMALSRALRLH